MMQFAKSINFIKSAPWNFINLFRSPKLTCLVGDLLLWLIGRQAKEQENNLSRAKHILVVRLDEIGDVVMSTPFLRELRRNLPGAWITLIVKPALYNLVELCPYINEVLTYNWNTNKYLSAFRKNCRALKLARQHLWRRSFDLAIVPRWDVDGYHATFIAYVSGAPWRVGYSENVIDHKRRLNKGFDRLFTHVLHDNRLKHEVEHNLDVIRFLGGQVQDNRLEFWLSEADKAFADQFLMKNRVNPGDLLISLALGAGAPKRIWPIQRFAQIGLWLRNEYGARILVVGGPGEEVLAEELELKMGSCIVNATSKTTLRQAAALLKRCQLFIGNDAGPMHLAAAVDVPVIEISCHPKNGSPFHPNSPQRFRPWGVFYRVLQPESPQAPCINECASIQPHCILRLTVEQVKQAVVEQLGSQMLSERKDR